MNALSSECSSGCESGWTLYFEQSSSDYDGGVMRIEDDEIPGGELKKAGLGKKGFDDEDDEEEDLSMVSDASSGPPIHYQVDEGPRPSTRCAVTAERKNSKRQKMIKRGQDKDFHSLLDDTASSPAITNQCVWKAGDEIQEGRRSAYQEHYEGFLHSPISGQHHDKNQWFGRKNVKKWR